MPVPEERLHNPRRLNRWFAISSVIMTWAILWMIWNDYDRPWREYQSDYFTGKAAIAHFDYLDTKREDYQTRIAEAREEVEAARELIQSTHGQQRQELEDKLAEAQLQKKIYGGRHSAASQVLDVTRDTYNRRLAEHGANHPETKSALNQLESEEEEVVRLQEEKEHWADEVNHLEDELRDLNEPIREAEKALADLEDVRKRALEKDQEFRGVLTDEGLLGGVPIRGWLINAPIFDFAAPWTTKGRQHVHQLVLPEVKQRLNYLEGYTTDRCTTCHVSIDDPDFSMDRLARKFESVLPAINEELQRDGMDPLNYPASPTLPDGRTPPPGKVTAVWNELSRTQKNEYFEGLLERANSYLKMSGRKTIELGQPLLAHPDLDLYLTPESPHPMKQVGCTVCHEGNPQETDFVLAAHSPPTHKIEEEWKEEHYVRHLGVPYATFELVEHYWDRPMRLPQYSESGCAKCHQQITDITTFEGNRHGERINLGQQLFRETGCINCHNVDQMAGARRVGPNLQHVADKLEPGFVQQWVWFPQEFRPSTRMPHFFLQENSDSTSENDFDPHPVLRTETEVAAITHYLFAVSQPWDPIEKPSEVNGDVERGRQLFRSVGCAACHSNLAEYGEEQITRDLVQRAGIDEETARYRYRGMTYEQRVRYAMDHFSGEVDTFLNPEEVRFEPSKEYKPPVFSRFAPELSGIGSKVTFDWLYSWLMEPTHYAPDTKMPSLRLTPSEAADLASYLLTLKLPEFDQHAFAMDDSRRDQADEQIFTLLSAQRSADRSRAIMEDRGRELTDMMVSLLKASPTIEEQEAYDLVSGMSLEDRKLLYLGSKMIGHYGCYTCHNIPGFESTTPVGTDLSTWAEKPVGQLDFAFYDHGFHHMRHEQEEEFGFVYKPDAERLNHHSPIPDDTKEQITHTHHAFAKHKMLNPRIWDRAKIKKPYDKLKMPNFYFTEKEAEALTTYLLSRIPARVTDELSVDYEGERVGPIAKGRALTRELNCVACHQIEDNAPSVQHYFSREIGGEVRFDELNAPPRLWGQGAKVQPDWMHRFFGHVETLRPWLQIRMPSFHLTNEEKDILVDYFAALTQEHGAYLAEAHAPIVEFVEAEQSKAAADEGAGSDDDEPAPGANWYRDALLQDEAEQLRRFAVDRKLMRPADFDPLANDEAQMREAHTTLRERTGFMADHYDIEYPFGEPPIRLSPEDRFQRGQEFFIDMGCLKCHVFGDMLPGPAKTTDDFVQTYRLDAVRGEGEDAFAILNGIAYPVGATIDGFELISAEMKFYESGDMEVSAILEGPNAEGETEQIQLFAPSAPNLNLTYKRLRRDWFKDWMLQPGWIQPGTKMPQNFPGGRSPFEGMEEYPGTGMDHVELLTDYVYEAGTKGERVPLTKITVSTEDEEFFEGGFDEFDEEDFD